MMSRDVRRFRMPAPKCGHGPPNDRYVGLWLVKLRDADRVFLADMPCTQAVSRNRLVQIIDRPHMVRFLTHFRHQLPAKEFNRLVFADCPRFHHPVVLIHRDPFRDRAHDPPPSVAASALGSIQLKPASASDSLPPSTISFPCRTAPPLC